MSAQKLKEKHKLYYQGFSLGNHPGWLTFGLAAGAALNLNTLCPQPIVIFRAAYTSGHSPGQLQPWLGGKNLMHIYPIETALD